MFKLNASSSINSDGYKRIKHITYSSKSVSEMDSPTKNEHCHLFTILATENKLFIAECLN